MYYDEKEAKKMDDLRNSFIKAEEKYREEMDSCLKVAQDHLKKLFDLSEESGLPFHIDGEKDPWGYMCELERWRTVSIPESFRKKFEGLTWRGSESQYGYSDKPRGESFQYWMASTEC